MTGDQLKCASPLHYIIEEKKRKKKKEEEINVGCDHAHLVLQAATTVNQHEMKVVTTIIHALK